MASTSAVLTLLLFLGVVVQPLDAMQLKVNEFSMLMPNVTVKYVSARAPSAAWESSAIRVQVTNL